MNIVYMNPDQLHYRQVGNTHRGKGRAYKLAFHATSSLYTPNCVGSIITETSTNLKYEDVEQIVYRIEGIEMIVDYIEEKQDAHLAGNQENGFRCGDNGIFKGTPVTVEQALLTHYARKIYKEHPFDGKYILDLWNHNLVICQSNTEAEDLQGDYPDALINPLGYWTGGPDVDTGATNRKLGSDMGDSVTGGGLHGKDLSKADVSVNIYAWLQAQETGKTVELGCAIGDDMIDGRPYSEIVEIARDYINRLGGFEAFAEWGLIR